MGLRRERRGCVKLHLWCDLLLIASLAFTGCIQNKANNAEGRNRGRDGVIANGPGSVSSGHGRVIFPNPVVQSGDRNLPFDVNLGLYLTGQVFITNNGSLLEACTQTDPVTLIPITIPNCFQVLKKQGESPLLPISNRWAFPPNSDEFLQVHTFYHTKQAVNKFHNSLSYAYSLSNPNPFAPSYSTSIPNNLYTQGAFWYDARNLISYSACGDFANAFFDPANFTLCYGIDPNNPGLEFAQDASVVYHEVGHAIVKIWSNMRNIASLAPVVPTGVRTDLGVGFYDEAGAINEGIADYISHVMTNRTHFGEWALRQFSRPIGEEDAIHPNGVNETSEGRLSYPDFIDFDAQFPTILVEDIHLTGQIASHFFKELQDTFVSQCKLSTDNAKNNVLYLIAETLGDLGDLTSRSSDTHAALSVHRNLTQKNPANLDDFLSYRWAHYINPINFRSFFQTFGFYLHKIFNTGTACNGAPIGTDTIERLMDDYGLLLFKTYNDNRNGFNDPIETGHTGALTAVDDANRLKSILISKDLIKLNPVQNATQAFVFDKREDLVNVIANLKFSGSKVGISNQINEDLIFNNNNGRVSPGEIVGLALNLYNDSNTTMGGVQVLANDWDQAKINPTTGALEACNNFADSFPLSSEGAADRSTETVPPTAGDCNHITKFNGSDTTNATPNEPLAPVCWVQMLGQNETKWVSQNEYRKHINLDSSKCLHQDGQYNNCLLNAIEGARHAFFSRIDSKKTWSESLSVVSGATPENPDGNLISSAQFTSSNLILFEVSPWITPGTTFDCRFRVRFSNCLDCWTDTTRADLDDYLDYEYSGGTPYKILHLQFTVVD